MALKKKLAVAATVAMAFILTVALPADARPGGGGGPRGGGGFHKGGGGPMGGGHMGGPRGKGGEWGAHRGGMGPRGGGLERALGDSLTEEQRGQLKQIRTENQGKMKDLRDRIHSGELTRDEARQEMSAIRESTHAKVEGMLTDEQKQTLAEKRAEREKRREERRQLHHDEAPE